MSAIETAVYYEASCDQEADSNGKRYWFAELLQMPEGRLFKFRKCERGKEEAANWCLRWKREFNATIKP